jgi:uncharacterized membrane protein
MFEFHKLTEEQKCAWEIDQVTKEFVGKIRFILKRYPNYTIDEDNFIEEICDELFWPE